ncbi:MAG: protein kinase, partial [Myxococcota bacterium]|nr:protein kinase [Myxococcota bacterium]
MLQPAPILRLGPFILEEPIGRGGMGEVWRGRHHAQPVPVAVKVITDAAALDPGVRRAFDNEVRSVARLDHPGIVQVLDYGTIDSEAAHRGQGRLVEGSPFLAMELLSGGCLDTAVVPTSWDELREILRPLLAALAHAHSRGLVHRDLTPGNILFAGTPGSREGLRITDFGIAHALVRDEENEDEDDDSSSGTVAYMSPEQLHGRWRDHGPWTDLYAVGCIAWELATGRRPVEGDTVYSVIFARLNGELAPFEARLDLPPRFEDWVRRLLERDPRDRFRAAADAAFALDELRGAPVFGPPPLPTSWASVAREQRAESLPLDVGLGLHGLRSMPALGREAQLDCLWTALREVWARATPRLVILRGSGQSGKSHLARLFCERAAEVGGASVLRVVHDRMPSLRSGVDAMVRSGLCVEGLDRGRLTARVDEVLSRESVTDPWEIGALVQLLAPTDEVPEDGEQPVVRFGVPRERNMVVQRFLKRRASERPLILVLEDLQWGSESLSLVAQLLAEPAAALGAVLVVATVDSLELEKDPVTAGIFGDLLAQPGSEEVEVPPLDDESIVSLARKHLGLSETLARQVSERAAGNPSFAVQLVGDWVHRGLLQPTPEGLQPMEGAVEEPGFFPESVEAIWRSRVTRVVSGFGAEAYRTLEVAAALGRQVDAFEWNHACSQAGLRAEAGLIDALLVEGLALPNESGWSFRSEVFRAELEQSARISGAWPNWNEAAAAMVQQRHRGGGKGVARRRALHLLEAGALGEAVSELGEAAWEFVEANEFRQALSMVDLREQAMRGIGAGPSDPRWGECMLVRCGVRLHLGDYEVALQQARKAEVEACRYGWNNVLARALGQQAVVMLQQGDRQEAAERWDEAIRLCSSRDVETRARLLWYLAEVRRQSGELEDSRSLHEAAAELFARKGDIEGEAEARLGLALVAHDRGQLEEAEALLDRAEPMFERAGSRTGLAATLNVRATVAQLRGDLEASVRHYRRAVE